MNNTALPTVKPFLIALGASAALVIAVGVAVISSADGPHSGTTTTTVSESHQLAPPVTSQDSVPVSSDEEQKSEKTQVNPAGYKNRHISTPKVTPAIGAGPTATTTPNMPPEPVEQQRNIGKDAEADPDTQEHISAGTDYDLPVDAPKAVLSCSADC